MRTVGELRAAVAELDATIDGIDQEVNADTCLPLAERRAWAAWVDAWTEWAQTANMRRRYTVDQLGEWRVQLGQRLARIEACACRQGDTVGRLHLPADFTRAEYDAAHDDYTAMISDHAARVGEDTAAAVSVVRQQVAHTYRALEEWLNEFSVFLSESQEADYDRRVLQPLRVADVLMNRTNPPDVRGAQQRLGNALAAWPPFVQLAQRQADRPVSLVQQEAMEQAHNVANAAIPVAQYVQQLAGGIGAGFAVAAGVAVALGLGVLALVTKGARWSA